jgi:hypothetical protein
MSALNRTCQQFQPGRSIPANPRRPIRRLAAMGGMTREALIEAAQRFRNQYPRPKPIRRRMWIRLAAVAVAACALLAGCAGPGDPAPTASPGDGPGSTSAAPTSPASDEPKGGFRVLETGTNSGIGSDGFEGRVLRDQAAWEAFWAEHKSWQSEPGSPPAVDFAGGEAAVAVFMGNQSSSGYSIEVSDASPAYGGLLVHYVTWSPGGGCATAAVTTQPFQLVAVPLGHGAEAGFQPDGERVRDC